MATKKELEKEYLKSLPCPEIDEFNTSGVLLSNEIEYYSRHYQMITPFNEDNLKAASYELTVGENFSLGGKKYSLSEEPEKNEIHIPPFEVVIIQTAEKINLPRFIIARWNVRVRYAYAGLLWVGGPQVDPGWVGNLSCPLYNLSAEYVVLKLGEPIAIMDFVKTTPYYSGKPGTATCVTYEKTCKSYPRPPSRIVFDDYDTSLKSALYEEAKTKIEKIESDIHEKLARIREKVSKYGDRLDQFMSISFAAIAILVAALSIFVTSGQPEGATKNIVLPIWLYLFVIFSMGALFFSTWSFFKYKSLKSQLNNLAKTSQSQTNLSQSRFISSFSNGQVITIGSFIILILILTPIIIREDFILKIHNLIFYPYSFYIPIILLVISISLGLFQLDQNADDQTSEKWKKISLIQKIIFVFCLIVIVWILLTVAS